MTVYLVGAGPGDPGLITVKGRDVLSRAEVVVYDRLSAPALLELAPSGAERVFVGKGRAGPSTPQEDINRLLVELGRRHRVVVRLKGGDPFVFARGAEELDALLSAGIAVEVVPGISSAIAAPAYAGIAVTRRYSSTSFTVVTGHEDPNKDSEGVNWEAIAAVGGTIVVLMGVGNLPEISARLIAAGLSPQTPAAAVRWGTRPDQEVVQSDLANLSSYPLSAPSVIVIGEVAGELLDWLGSRPLSGMSVVVTRSSDQASRLSDRLEAAGAAVVRLPTIEIADPSDGGAALAAAIDRIDDYEWVVLSSPNGARRFLDAVGDARRLSHTRLAVIGPGTAAVLAERMLTADLVPERYVAEGLLEVFESPGPDSRRILLAQAAVTRGVLGEGLAAIGWKVDVAEAYQTIPATPDGSSIAAVAAADLVAFASSSAVTGFTASVPRASWPRVAAAIGPITAETARTAGFAEVIEAEQHDLDGLVGAVLQWAGAKL